MRFRCLVFPFLSGVFAACAAAEPAYSLAECLDLARRQNPEVLGAVKQVEQARALVTVAKAGRFPTLRADGYYQIRQRDLATSGGANPTTRPEDYTLTTSLVQSLYSAGAVRERIAIARLNEEIAGRNLRAALDTTALNVRLAFYQVLAAQSAIGIRREGARILEDQVEDQQGRLKAGTVSSLNVTRAQVSAANERPALIEAQRDFQTAVIQLAQVMGVKYSSAHPGAPFRIRGALDLRGPAQDLRGSITRALAQRPEIEARRFELEAAERQQTVEKAGNRPQVSGFVNHQLFSEPDRNAPRENFNGFTIGLNATWTLFDGLATPGRVRAAQARVSGLREALRATELAVESEVRTAFATLEQARATMRSQAQNVALAREALRLALDNFGAGLATQLDILQAQLDLTRAQVSELSGRVLHATAVARIERAVSSGVGRDAKALSPAKP